MSGAAATAPASIYAKLRELTEEVGAVEMRGHNDHQNYDYMTAEDLLKSVRGPLATKGLTLVPSLTSVAERQIQTRNGVSTITTAHLRFTIADNNGCETFDWAGQGQDPGDKGLGKAYTNALKTFLRSLLLIPQGQEDPESDPQTDADAQSRVVEPPRTQTQDPLNPPTEDQEKALREMCAQHMEKIKESSPEVWARVEAWAEQRSIDLDTPPSDKLRALEKALRRKVEEAEK